jgi:A/G-specific adenine glycosylase
VRSKQIVAALLRWYRVNARNLPWRRTRDPYAIWISEIMLQQTQVKTVIPYWERWMRELPTISKLASARLDRVLKLWEGLGYYSRARNAQNAARIILQEHRGKFPEIPDEIRELPGIGPYTAGAICSIAFDQPAAILDGNVIRVLTRLYGICENPKAKQTNLRLWQIAAELVNEADRNRVNGERSCSDFNQSLMELGAVVCTPTAPVCGICPLRRNCVARLAGTVDILPRKPQRKPPIARHFRAFVTKNEGRYLVRRRPSAVVNGRLWEFPNEEKPATSLMRRKAPETRLCTIKHTITNNRITMDVFLASSAKGKGLSEGRWCTLKELERLAFSSAHRQIVDKLRELEARSDQAGF